jgi:YEATS domain-containing protein 4
LNQKEVLDRFEKIYQERLSKKGNLELTIAYGNEHIYLNTEGMNKHKWKAFVRLEKSNQVLKSILDKFKLNAYAKLYFYSIQNPENEMLKKLLDLMRKKDEKESEFSNINPEELNIIKKVSFELHPTFNPPSVFVEEKPFEIQRLGWGTFNIEILVEFNDNLNIGVLNLEYELCFTRPITKKIHPIWIKANLDL